MWQRVCNFWSRWGFRVGAFLSGVIVGGLLVLALQSYLGKTGSDGTFTQVFPNAVIAFASVIALLISHVTNVRQRETRRWEVSKDVLLELGRTVSEQLHQIGRLADHEFDLHHASGQGTGFQYDAAVGASFVKSLRTTKNLYGAILSDKVNESVEKYLAHASGIESAFNDGAMDSFAAYNEDFGALKELMKEIHKSLRLAASL